jgi:hypothetical protein
LKFEINHLRTKKINMIFNKSRFIVTIGILLMVGISCSKGSNSGGGGTTPVPEDPIVFTINPDPGSNIYAALGATQDFTLSITSKLPPAGVKIDLKLTKDLDGSSVFSQSVSSSVGSLTINFQNLGSGTVCTGVITVTSASTSSNSSSKTFKIAKK